MSLFALKVRRLFESLTQEGIMDKLSEDAIGTRLSPLDDGKTRLVLCSPGVNYAARLQVGLDESIRIRLAIPKDLNPLYLADESTIEIYNHNGLLLAAPQPLKDVTPHMACAIEAELFHAIVRAKGICIPMQE